MLDFDPRSYLGQAAPCPANAEPDASPGAAGCSCVPGYVATRDAGTGALLRCTSVCRPDQRWSAFEEKCVAINPSALTQGPNVKSSTGRTILIGALLIVAFGAMILAASPELQAEVGIA